MRTHTDRWLEILAAPARHQLTVTEVCRRYHISRKTYYTYLARYRAEGPAGLTPRSRRPHHVPGRSPAEVEAVIIHLRRTNPHWGARRIRTELAAHPTLHTPATSTIHAILHRHHLIGSPSDTTTTPC